MNRIRMWGITALTMLGIVCLGSSMLRESRAETGTPAFGATDGPMGYDWTWGSQHTFGNIGVTPPVIMDAIQYATGGASYTVTFGRKNGSADPEGFLTQHTVDMGMPSSTASIPGFYFEGALNPSFGQGNLDGVLLLKELQHPLIPAHTGRLMASHETTDASVPNRVIVVVGAAAKQEQIGDKSITRNVVALSGVSHQGYYLAPGFSGWLEVDLGPDDIGDISPTSPFTKAKGGYVSANGQTIAIQLDKKIVVTAELTAHSITAGTELHRVALLRFLPNAVFSTESGAVKPLSNVLDSSFGAGGKVILPGTIDYVWDSLLQSDGKILVAVNGSNATLVYRLDTTGALDNTFGQGGVVTLPQVTGAGSLALKSSGIVYGGKITQKTADEQPVDHFAICQMGFDGALDQNFGTAGCVQTPVQNYTQLMIGDIVAHSSGKIYIVGTAGVPNQNKDIFTMRLTALGSADLQYGMNGVMITSFDAGGKANYEGASALILQDDGRLIVGGYVENYEVQPTAMAFLQRLQPNNFSTVSALPTAYDLGVTSPTASEYAPDFSPTDLKAEVAFAWAPGKDNTPITTSSMVAYAMTITNNGPNLAKNVVVTTTLTPSNASPMLDGTDMQCTPGDPLVCKISSLPAGASAKLSLATWAPSVAGTMLYSVSVKGNQEDPDLTNNTASVSATVVALETTPAPGSPPPAPPPAASPLPAANADLYVAVGVDYQGYKEKQPAKPNSPITYTVKVTNKGPSDATKVVVIDTLPTGTTAKFEPANCKSKGGTVACSLGTLKPGGTATIKIESTTPAKPGVLINKATVKSATPDAVPGNNTRSIKVKVQ